jgi:hypothetical protein
MGVRVHKFLGYGLTDVTYDGGRLTDPRINQDRPLLHNDARHWTSTPPAGRPRLRSMNLDRSASARPRRRTQPAAGAPPRPSGCLAHRPKYTISSPTRSPVRASM